MSAGEVILASPVRQSPDVLREFLRAVDASGHAFWAYDDTDIVVSREMLAQFCDQPGRRILPPLELPQFTPYKRLASSHLWTAQTYARVGAIKNHLIGQFLQSDARYLFLVDSDVLVCPGLVEHLVALDLPIVSEVFWTRWNTQTPRLPQVWRVHPGGFESADWIIRLREPGRYRVSGLGACTLLNREVFDRDLSFKPIDGLQYHGEDRHFCLRANVMGIPLFVDTEMPAYHVYREDDLAGGKAWIDAGYPYGTIRGWLDAEWELSVRRWLKTAHSTGLDPSIYLGCTEPWVTDFLASLCLAIDAKRALEIGVYTGKTTGPLAGAVRELVAIDREIRVEAINALQMYPNVRLIEGEAVEVLRTLGGPFDFVYVDAGHRYEDVKSQTEAVWPLVRNGGIVAFHDALAKDDDGVTRYLRERFPEAILLDTKAFPWTVTGLGLVQKRGDV